MKGRLCFRNPFKAVVVKLIRSTLMDNEAIRHAYLSLRRQDRDCLPYVPRLLQLEGNGAESFAIKDHNHTDHLGIRPCQSPRSESVFVSQWAVSGGAPARRSQA